MLGSMHAAAQDGSKENPYPLNTIQKEGSTGSLTHNAYYRISPTTGIEANKTNIDNGTFFFLDYFKHVEDNIFQFKGKTGRYDVIFETYQDGGANKASTVITGDGNSDQKVVHFMKIWPRVDGYLADDDWQKDFTTNMFNPSTISGPLWLCGGKTTFNTPNLEWYPFEDDWSHGHSSFHNYNTNHDIPYESGTTSADNFAPMPNISSSTDEDKLTRYQITLMTGYNFGLYSALGAKWPAFKIYFSHALTLNTDADDGAGGKIHNQEFRGASAANPYYAMEPHATDWYDFMEITDGGNIQPKQITSCDGADTRLVSTESERKLPSGYSFTFFLDFDEDNFTAPLTTSQKAKLHLKRNFQYHSEDADPTNNYTIDLLNEKRTAETITLRDALRFQLGLDYDTHLTTNYFTTGDDKTFVIKHFITLEDLAFLKQMMQQDANASFTSGKGYLFSKLDLRQATIEGNAIPSGFAQDCTHLEEIYLPGSVTRIEADAFNGCTGLKVFKVDGTQQIEIGERAFKNCGSTDDLNSNSETIDGISYNDLEKFIKVNVSGTISANAFENCKGIRTVNLMSGNVNSIGEKAFADCTNITDVYVPKAISGSSDTPISGKETEAAVTGVGSKFNNWTISSSTGTVKFEAEDFNSGEGTGWYHSDTNNEDDNYRTNNGLVTDGVHNGIKNNANYSGNHDIGYNDPTSGSPFNWFNYTFYCAETGYYTIGAGLGTGIATGEKKVQISFSGNATTFDVVLPEAGRVADNWANINTSCTADNAVLLEKGWHYMHVYVPQGGIELDYYTLTWQKAYNSASGIVQSTRGDSWSNVNANNCEVHFDGTDDVNNYQAYRADEQEGWMYLLTKSIYENKNREQEGHSDYNVCHQLHADVLLNRTYSKSGWYTMVLPYDITVQQLLDATDANGKKIFTTAAYFLDYNPAQNHLRFNYLGQKNSDMGTTTPDNPYGQDNSFKMVAGKPFVVKLNLDGVSGANEATYYSRFADVESKAKADVMAVSASSSVDKGIGENVKDESGNKKYGEYTDGNLKFTGTYNANNTYNASDASTYVTDVYGLSQGSLVYAAKAHFNGYRGWFTIESHAAKVALIPFFVDSYMDDAALPVSMLDFGGRTDTYFDIYNINGQKVRSHATDTSGLPKGIYIVNGRKFIVR